MSLDAGSVFATLGGRFSPAGFTQFDAAMKKSAASAEAAETKIAASQKRSGAAIAGVGKVAGVAGLAVAAGYLAAMNAAAKFEKQMSEVKAVSKASVSDFKKMRDAALDLGAKTGVGATQAARGLTELAKGGMSARESTKALAATITLAQAGNMDLADASSTVVQSLSTFNLGAKDATMVADGLASAANKTTMDVSDFAQALAQGGVIAQAAGFDFDQTIDVLGTMANRFRSGSDMGTSFKTAILALANPSKKAAAEMQRLNIDLFDHSGKAKSAGEIVKMLGNRFGEMTQKQRIASAGMIAGSDSARTLLALAQGSTGQIREQGAAADVAAEKMNNFSGEWKKLKSQGETIAIKIGTPGIEWATDQLRQVNDVMRRLEDMPDIGLSINSDGLAGEVAEIALQLDKLLVVFTVATEAAVSFGSTMGRFIPGDDKFDSIARGAREATDAINAARESLQTLGGTRIAGQKLSVDEGDAVRAVSRLSNKEIKTVLRIVGNSQDAETKINRIRTLGIPLKYAKIIASGAENVQAAIDAIHGKTVEIRFRQITTIETRRGRASGRGTGSAETALVGEGGGPEAVGNPRDGFRMTTGPGLAALGPDDYVIPTEPKYRGRALGLMADALGIPGFKKGKKPKRKPRPIPKSVYLGHSVEFFDSEVSHLEQVAQDRDKKNKLTAKAKRARKQLAEMKRVQKQARSYDDRVKKHEDEANIQRDNMQAADSRDDVKGYKAAWGNRKSELTRARVLLRGALKFAPPSSKYHQDIRARIAGINALLDDMTGDKAGSPLEAKDDAATTFTTGEQERLDRIDADIALAALTAPTTDDLAAQRAKEGFLAPLLAAVQASGGAGRGGSQAITDIAGDLKTTRETIAELTKAPDVTADQQATAEQSYQRGLAEGKGSSIDRLVGAATGSPITVNYNALTASPRDAQRATETIVAGIGYQGGRPRSSTRVAA